ncbi:MAG: hypothetical protein E6R12_03090 [Sphingomonadales bacterium]|nr:MAG: hypothetical protein E6R12_03090 [Sphingomonadales bacterium]
MGWVAALLEIARRLFEWLAARGEQPAPASVDPELVRQVDAAREPAPADPDRLSDDGFRRD